MELRTRAVATKRLKNNQEFNLRDLPPDLSEALTGFDVDGNGTVTMSELAEGARLLRRTQEKVRTQRRDSSANSLLVHTRP